VVFWTTTPCLTAVSPFLNWVPQTRHRSFDAVDLHSSRPQLGSDHHAATASVVSCSDLADRHLVEEHSSWKKGLSHKGGWASGWSSTTSRKTSSSARRVPCCQSYWSYGSLRLRPLQAIGLSAVSLSRRHERWRPAWSLRSHVKPWWQPVRIEAWSSMKTWSSIPLDQIWLRLLNSRDGSASKTGRVWAAENFYHS